MSKNIICFKHAHDREGSPCWELVEPPDSIRVIDEVVWLRIDRSVQASVSGIPVVDGVHVLEHGDLVRIRVDTSDDRPEAETYYIGRRTTMRLRNAKGVDLFSGETIDGPAVRCACGLLLSQATVDYLAAELAGKCPECGHLLVEVEEEDEVRPPDALL